MLLWIDHRRVSTRQSGWVDGRGCVVKPKTARLVLPNGARARFDAFLTYPHCWSLFSAELVRSGTKTIIKLALGDDHSVGLIKMPGNMPLTFSEVPECFSFTSHVLQQHKRCR